MGLAWELGRLALRGREEMKEEGRRGRRKEEGCRELSPQKSDSGQFPGQL